MRSWSSAFPGPAPAFCHVIASGAVCPTAELDGLTNPAFCSSASWSNTLWGQVSSEEKVGGVAEQRASLQGHQALDCLSPNGNPPDRSPVLQGANGLHLLYSASDSKPIPGYFWLKKINKSQDHRIIQVVRDLRRSLAQPPAQSRASFEARLGGSGLYPSLPWTIIIFQLRSCTVTRSLWYFPSKMSFLCHKSTYIALEEKK